MKRVLFVCGQNRLRSPTAEQVFSTWSGLECSSAGLKNEADNPVTREMVEWAEVIFVMEKSHRNKLSTRFKPWLSGKRMVCLDIPDNYGFMDPDLIEILRTKVPRHLPNIAPGSDGA